MNINIVLMAGGKRQLASGTPVGCSTLHLQGVQTLISGTIARA